MQKTHTVMCVKNAEILRMLEIVRAEVKEMIGCRRQPGVQVVLDMLIQFYLNCPKDARWAFIGQFKTEIVGYPNSKKKNPGSFS